MAKPHRLLKKQSRGTPPNAEGPPREADARSGPDSLYVLPAVLRVDLWRDGVFRRCKR